MTSLHSTAFTTSSEHSTDNLYSSEKRKVSYKPGLLETVGVGMATRMAIRWYKGKSTIDKNAIIHDLALEGLHAMFVGKFIVFDIPLVEGKVQSAMLVVIGKVLAGYGIDFLLKSQGSNMSIVDRFMGEAIVEGVRIVSTTILSAMSVEAREDMHIYT